MLNGNRSRCAPVLLALWLCGASVVSGAAEESASQGAPPEESPRPWFHIGPLRIRDLTPFGILRLDFLPAHAVTARPGTWAFEVNLSYQNTYVLSDSAVDYLRTVGGGSRVHVGPEHVPGMLAAGDEVYYVDGELGLFDLTLHCRFSPHWGGYVTVPALIFQNGVLDGTIESFHNTLGLDNGNRDLAVRNDFFVVTKTHDGTVVITEPPKDGFADPVFGARYSLVPAPDKWNLIFEAAVKAAFRDAKVFVSSGETDYGVQVSFQRFFRRQALYFSGSAVQFAGVDLEGISDDDMLVPTFVGAWEFGMGKHLNGILQLYSSPSIIRNTDLEELKAHKYLASFGVQAAWRSWFYRFALTENLENFEQTADIAVTLSFAKAFGLPDR